MKDFIKYFEEDHLAIYYIDEFSFKGEYYGVYISIDKGKYRGNDLFHVCLTMEYSVDIDRCHGDESFEEFATGMAKVIKDVAIAIMPDDQKIQYGIKEK